MNKFFLVTLMIGLSVVLVACQSSATSEVTVTFTATLTPPIPTPTIHPEFIELQNIIAQTERFTLPSVEDGILYDGSPIAGLEVGRDGTITLNVGDDQVVIDQSQIHFDDDGVTIDGYELDENGKWVEKEALIIGGVTMTVDENGVVTDKSVDGDYTPEQQAEKLAQFDPTRVGFAPDATVLIMDGQYPKIVSAEDHSNVIAEWNFGKNELVWDWSKMVDPATGDNVIFNIAKTWEMKGVNPVDRDSAEADSVLIRDFASQKTIEMSGSQLTEAIYIYNHERNLSVGAYLLSGTNATLENKDKIDKSKGTVCFMDKDGNLIDILVENFSFDMRYWN